VKENKKGKVMMVEQEQKGAFNFMIHRAFLCEQGGKKAEDLLLKNEIGGSIIASKRGTSVHMGSTLESISP